MNLYVHVDRDGVCYCIPVVYTDNPHVGRPIQVYNCQVIQAGWAGLSLFHMREVCTVSGF